ncbi:hypothetical protein PBI_GAIA_161 [Mycobacterium phage Gaia]|uniref:Uncharacterized protein n=1 Tax=Mycobacterium phage Gaia TaxID=1486472 RepID=A0A068F1Z8_9CAUD|nr:hypothetical protein VC46_gp075 [Mycobacterium phage Gaia]AID58977.1 hypothetical protein PBI_GAIA_161 [Mycobacterium phage Gaia]AYR00088.1 hypothetical protein PBI_NEBKISS_157 [Mycobacterium phage Nebkiss]
MNRPIKPQASATVDDTIAYLNSFDMFKTVHRATVEHATGRYPHIAVCPCGWRSRGCLRDHTAQIMADDHNS